MKQARLGRALALCSLFTFVVAVVGCGSGSQQADRAEIRQGNREFFKTKAAQQNAKASTHNRGRKR